MTPPPTDHPLPLTGARTLPGVPDENYWFQRHVAAYDHVARIVSGTILDAGCGEGYGLAILHAAGARGVIGVDVDPPTVGHARQRYGHDGVSEVDVVEADLVDLPLVDDTLDAVVCLKVVEHLADPDAALAELVRVGRAGADLVVSARNRAPSSPDDGPRSPFHLRAFDADELVTLLSRAGVVVEQVYGLHHGEELQGRLQRLAGEDPVALLVDATTWDPTLRQVVHDVRAADFTVLSAAERSPDTALDLLAWGRITR